MLIGYTRRSTYHQQNSHDKQIEYIENHYKIDKWFNETASGKSMERPVLKEMLSYIRENDQIIIWELSRISRSTKDLLDISEVITSKGAKLISIKESIVIGDEENPMSKFIKNVMIALYEMERELIVERTREGVARAQQAGKYRGKPEGKYDIEQLKKYKKQIDNGETTKAFVAKKLGISRPTLDKRLKTLAEMEAEANG